MSISTEQIAAFERRHAALDTDPGHTGRHTVSPTAGPGSTAGAGPGAAPVANGPARRRLHVSRPAVTAALGLLVGVAVGVGAALALTRDSAPPADPRAAAVVTVQNQIAEGSADVTVDDDPAYFSTRPESRCAAKGCMVPGSTLAVGDHLAATCSVRTGVPVRNYNAEEDDNADNPHRDESDLWYHASTANGSHSGYIAAIWLDPRDRDGHPVPPCT